MQPNEVVAEGTGEVYRVVSWAFSPERDKIAAALAKAQGEIGHAEKNATNPHFHRRYADLAAVWDAAREPLAKNGLCVIQLPGAAELETQLLHESGQWIACRTPILFGEKETGRTRAQAYGSALTYARRYALSAVLGIAQVDDDGNAAGRSPEATQGQPKAEQPPDASAEQLADEFIAEFRRIAAEPPTMTALQRLESIPPKIKAANLPQSAYQRAVAAYNPVVIALRDALGVNGSNGKQDTQ